ncbi:MAG TPA: hypothetical protein VK174_11700 [Chitinophagales bacterium]|nr:hypothetical protein [Chitinophagales bacterium]
MTDETNPANTTRYRFNRAFNKFFYTSEGLSQVFKIVVGLSSVVYIVGYVTWALYASENHLGYLPAIKEQYFVAGLIPTMILLIIFYAPLLHNLFTGQFQEFYFARTKKTQVFFILFFMFLGGVCLFLLLWFREELPKTLKWTLDILFYVIIYTIFIMSQTKWMLKWYMPIFLVITLNSFMFQYMSSIFPNLSREFGGPKEYKVEIDLNRREISRETCSLLFKGVDTFDVIRTKPLYFVFDAGEFVLLKEKAGKIDSANAIIRIKKDAIKAIF